jgi:hypothetical protein
MVANADLGEKPRVRNNHIDFMIRRFLMPAVHAATGRTASNEFFHQWQKERLAEAAEWRFRPR